MRSLKKIKKTADLYVRHGSDDYGMYDNHRILLSQFCQFLNEHFVYYIIIF